MQKISPYKSLADALRALDNGGRFYHLFTKAGDQRVEAAELKKAAGVFLDDQAAALFFELAIAELNEADRAEIERSLGPEARGIRNGHRPTWLAPAAFASTARAGKPFVVEGEVERVDDHNVTGMIFVPMMTGNVTTVMPIPTWQRFSVYALRGSSGRGPSGADACHVLTPKQAGDLQGFCRFGGIAKQGEVGEGPDKREVLRLEARFYTWPAN